MICLFKILGLTFWFEKFLYVFFSFWIEYRRLKNLQERYKNSLKNTQVHKWANNALQIEEYAFNKLYGLTWVWINFTIVLQTSCYENTI